LRTDEEGAWLRNMTTIPSRVPLGKMNFQLGARGWIEKMKGRGES